MGALVSKVFCVQPTSSVSHIMDLIWRQWASYQLEDISEDTYCEDVDPKKNNHCQFLTFQRLSSQVGCTYPSSCLSCIFFFGRRSKDSLFWFKFFIAVYWSKLVKKALLIMICLQIYNLYWHYYGVLNCFFVCVGMTKGILLAICFWSLWPGRGQGRAV